MSLKDWLDNGWLKTHQADKQEITAILALVDRDLQDASVNALSSDWKFGIAYNVALKLCTIVLYTNGYRPENALAHYRTIMALQEIEGKDWKSNVTYLNACRMRRNILEYNKAGIISSDEAAKLIEFSHNVKNEVVDYLTKHYPQLT